MADKGKRASRESARLFMGERGLGSTRQPSLSPARAASSRDSLQHPLAESRIEVELLEMDVTNVAAARFITARSRLQAALKPVGVDVANGLRDEMAAANRPVAIHAKDRRAGATGFALACVALIVDRKERVQLRQPRGLA